jgi:energy-coupling factor transport system ATP-binding protein
VNSDSRTGSGAVGEGPAIKGPAVRPGGAAERSAPAVHASGLSFTYSTRLLPALTGLSFEVAPGETVLMLGPSGSGKSTLTLCLDGLIPHLVEGDYAGVVTVAGLVVKDTPVRVLAGQTGVVFQDPDSQFCTLTVDDEVAFGLENLETPPEDIGGAIDGALELVRSPSLRGRLLTSLSGGEKQRVALAAVLAMGPRLLVLDEPTANLDPAATAGLFEIIRGLAADRQHTLLIIEHKLDEVIEWVDGVLALDAGGSLLFRGDPRTAFYDRSEQFQKAGIWRPQTVELVDGLRRAGWPVPGRPLGVAETAAAIQSTAGLADRLRVGPVGSAAPPERPGLTPVPEPAPLIEVKNLSFAYPGGRVALDDVSLLVRRGGFVAVVGANGAGKTTLGSLLSGVLSAPRGAVFLEGTDVTALSAWTLADNVGHVFQNPEHQFVSSTVKGELVFSLDPRSRGRSGHLSAEQDALVGDWLGRLGLARLAEANPFTLSLGQKRRLSVAAMLIRGCPALVLDEPTLGQDAVQSQRLMDMMREFNAGGGTVVMITHDMRIVAEYASNVLALAGGKVVYSGEPSGLFSRPQVVEAARLAMPALAGVGLLLRTDGEVPAGLSTVGDFLEAAGSQEGPPAPATRRRPQEAGS